MRKMTLIEEAFYRAATTYADAKTVHDCLKSEPALSADMLRFTKDAADKLWARTTARLSSYGTISMMLGHKLKIIEEARVETENLHNRQRRSMRVYGV